MSPKGDSPLVLFSMEIISRWELKGREEGVQQGVEQGLQEGKHDGKEELVVLMIERRFGSVAPEVTRRLDQLSSEQLNELGKALFDFTSPADLQAWLTQH